MNYIGSGVVFHVYVSKFTTLCSHSITIPCPPTSATQLEKRPGFWQLSRNTNLVSAPLSSRNLRSSMRRAFLTCTIAFLSPTESISTSTFTRLLMVLRRSSSVVSEAATWDPRVTSNFLSERKIGTTGRGIISLPLYLPSFETLD